jgi:voltage-gated potassium channel Kch
MDTDDALLRRIHGAAHRPEISPDLPMRAWIYAWLFDPLREGNHQRAMDRWISLLIVANLIALIFEHVPAIHDPHAQWFYLFDLVSVGIFTVEYVLRLYVAPEDPEFAKGRHPRWAYARSPFAIIDLLAILPFYLQALLPVDLRVLRFLRLLRILKLFRVLIPAWQEFALANRGRTFRQKVHALVFPSEFGGNLHQLFDGLIVLWVVLSVAAVILESVATVRYLLHLEFIILDAVAVTIFTAEYLLRLYSCVESPGYQRAVSGRVKHATSLGAIIDFLAILPFYLEVFLQHLVDLRFLRVFRLLRLFKLTRYTGATKTLTIVVVREWPVLAASAFVMLLLVIMTASLGYLFEHEAQPEKFENIPQSIYWAVITLASVGYGDISPVTPMGRAMTIILALLGIGIFAIPAALLSSAFTDQLRIEREALKNEMYEMLADGHLSEDEADKISREAKRLHLSDEEVQRLIIRAKRERESKEDVSVLPLHIIAANTPHALEYYRWTLANLRQIGVMASREDFERLATQSGRLTAEEFILWQAIQGTMPVAEAKPPAPPD